MTCPYTVGALEMDVAAIFPRTGGRGYKLVHQGYQKDICSYSGYATAFACWVAFSTGASYYVGT